MYLETGDTAYSTPVVQYLRDWFTGGTILYTPGGLVYRLKWGPLSYAGRVNFSV